MQTENIKIKAQEILDSLLDSATWDDLMQRIYIRQVIEAGIEDSEKGRTMCVKDVRKKFDKLILKKHLNELEQGEQAFIILK